LFEVGGYPSNERTLIWKHLLELPLNKENFEALLLKGPHPAYEHLYQKYPIEPISLYERFIRILSTLAHWCEFLTKVDFFPALVFPFVKSIENDDLVIFEITVSLLMHWSKEWF